MVVKLASSQLNQAIGMCLEVRAPVPLDLIVRAPTRLQGDLKDEDWFAGEIDWKGKPLYDKKHESMGGHGRKRFSRESHLEGKTPTLHDEL